MVLKAGFSHAHVDEMERVANRLLYYPGSATSAWKRCLAAQMFETEHDSATRMWTRSRVNGATSWRVGDSHTTVEKTAIGRIMTKPYGVQPHNRGQTEREYQ